MEGKCEKVEFDLGGGKMTIAKVCGRGSGIDGPVSPLHLVKFQWKFSLLRVTAAARFRKTRSTASRCTAGCRCHLCVRLQLYMLCREVRTTTSVAFVEIPERSLQFRRGFDKVGLRMYDRQGLRSVAGSMG